MDRLTYKSERGFIRIQGCTAKYSLKERKGAPLNSAIVRLFAYENTGFSPGALEEMLDGAYDLGYQACLTHKGLNWSEAEELQRYRDAKAKGRLLIPPCKAGGYNF